MKSRKTVEVDWLKKMINADLENEKLTEDTKKHLCTLLENILVKTGNYRGFNYLKWINGGFTKWEMDGRPTPTDKNYQKYLGDEYSRIYYQKGEGMSKGTHKVVLNCVFCKTEKDLFHFEYWWICTDCFCRLKRWIEKISKLLQVRGGT